MNNKSESPFEGEVVINAESFNSGISQKMKSMSVPASAGPGDLQLTMDYPMGDDVRYWSEFRPSLYKLTVNLKNSKGDVIDSDSTDFGMRDFKTSGTHFEVNGHQIFLRGTLECCIFPLTGYPPTDIEFVDESSSDG